MLATTEKRREAAKWRAARKGKVRLPRNGGSKGKGLTWAYDFETAGWERPLCAVAVSSDGDVRHYVGEDGAAELARHQREERGTWWGHAAGGFDHLLSWRRGELPHELILTGGSVLKGTAVAVRGRPPLVFRDSYPRWLVPLAKVGKAVGLPKLDADRADLESLPVEDLLAYCQRDAEIVLTGTLLQDAWLAARDCSASTSGSAAVQLLEALDPETWAQLASPRGMVEPGLATGLSPALNGRAGALEGVRGGRVEARVQGYVRGPIYVYDLHSSYPSQYAKGPLPAGCVVDRSTKLRAAHGLPWVDWCTWQGGGSAEQTAFELDGTNAGRGECSGWLTSEIAHALHERGARVKRSGCGFRGALLVGEFARSFREGLFREKEAGGASSFFAKVTLNSLHGKLSESPLRWRHVLREEHRGMRLGEVPGGLLDAYHEAPSFIPPRPYHQPVTAAFVLGRARLTLALAIEAVERAGFRFFYCDTDSLHTDCPPDVLARILPGQVGPDLGQWGLEFTAEAAIYLGPKLYALRNAKEQKGASKGFQRPDPKRPGEGATWERFAEAARALEVKLRRGGLKRIRQGATAGTRTELERTLRPVATGRRVLDGGRLDYLEAGTW